MITKMRYLMLKNIRLGLLVSVLEDDVGFGSTTFIDNLENNNVGEMAATLAYDPTYIATRRNLAPNFLVANPNVGFARVLTNAAF